MALRPQTLLVIPSNSSSMVGKVRGRRDLYLALPARDIAGRRSPRRSHCHLMWVYVQQDRAWKVNTHPMCYETDVMCVSFKTRGEYAVSHRVTTRNMDSPSD